MRVTHFRNHSVLLTLKSHFGIYPTRLTIHYPCKRNQYAFHTSFSPTSCIISMLTLLFSGFQRGFATVPARSIALPRGNQRNRSWKRSYYSRRNKHIYVNLYRTQGSQALPWSRKVWPREVFSSEQCRPASLCLHTLWTRPQNVCRSYVRHYGS